MTSLVLLTSGALTTRYLSIQEAEKHYTAFEADYQLFQFCRIPFGVTNGVACFERVMDKIIKLKELRGVWAYLDDVTGCGSNQKEHDENLHSFLSVANKYNLTINETKIVHSQKSIKLLEYLIQNKTIRPEPSRLKPLLKLGLPTNSASLRRVLGMFAHCSRCFTEKIHRLVKTDKCPINIAISDFKELKDGIAKAAVTSIEPFVVETDASEHSIAVFL